MWNCGLLNEGYFLGELILMLSGRDDVKLSGCVNMLITNYFEVELIF